MDMKRSGLQEWLDGVGPGYADLQVLVRLRVSEVIAIGRVLSEWNDVPLRVQLEVLRAWEALSGVVCEAVEARRARDAKAVQKDLFRGPNG